MGEIAEDCYDRALDELEMLGINPDYFDGGGMLSQPFAGCPRQPSIASLDDFDTLP